MQYSQHFSTTDTPQREPIPGKDMIENAEGAYVHPVSIWEHFKRFLVLGSEGGTFYTREREFTQENARKTILAIKEDGPQAIRLIKDFIMNRRVHKPDPGIFARDAAGDSPHSYTWVLPGRGITLSPGPACDLPHSWAYSLGIV